ncbi:hypothetical protein BNJ_00323 [Kaumoebavirus]|uniref:hypothetical protein n=1 Tax=Kaumoebavirus TaxID=1859492 RepID=UPI0009C327EF|nr:hypothetical protein BNJ_00323 [Kaumoebavirus]ARA72145.1 hypothetical protein BNJ_00323 [Kaumoebavirus]
MSHIHSIGTIPCTVEDDVEYLLLGLRPGTNDWDWMGGKTNAGETGRQAYEREIDEETPDLMRDLILGETLFGIEYKIHTKEGMIHVLKCRIPKGIDLSPGKYHTQYQWFSKKEVEEAWINKTTLGGYPLRTYLKNLFSNEGMLEFL